MPDLTFNDLRRAMNGGGLEEYQKELAKYLEAVAEIEEVNGRSLIAEGLRRKEYSKGPAYDDYYDPHYEREVSYRSQDYEAERARKAAEAEEKVKREAAAKAEAERIAREKQMEADRHYNANPVFGSL